MACSNIRMADEERFSRRVLVCFRQRSHPVTFSLASDSESDPDILLQEVLRTFGDQLVKGTQYLLQIKDAKWGGEFIDVLPAQEIPDKSIHSESCHAGKGKNLVHC